jgi:hypothetical protein
MMGMVPGTPTKPRTIHVHAHKTGDKWTVDLGDLGTTYASHVRDILRAAKDHAYLSGVPNSDDATYDLDVLLPVDAPFQTLIEQARSRDGDPAVRRTVARRLRDELGLSGTEIALVLGFTHQWVSQLLAKD